MQLGRRVLCHGILSALPEGAIGRIYGLLVDEYAVHFGQSAAEELARYDEILGLLGAEETRSELIEPDEPVSLSSTERAKMNRVRPGIYTPPERL